MRMKTKYLCRLGILLVALTTLFSCSNEPNIEPEPKPEPLNPVLVGYWYSDSLSLGFALNNDGSGAQYGSGDMFSISWNNHEIGIYEIVNVTTNTLTIEWASQYVLKRITLAQWENLITTGSIDNKEEEDEENDKPSGDKYEGETFVGNWKAVVEDWDETYYIKLKANGKFEYRFEEWDEWDVADELYSVSGDYITIPDCAISQGYGEEYEMDIVNNNKIIWIGTLFGDQITLTRQ